MNKKAIVLVCAVLALVFAFTACRHTSPYGQIVVDQQGLEHVIMTDANGVTVVDSVGDLVEIVTDSNSKKPVAAPTENGTAFAGQEGEYQTHAVTFPGVIESGDRIEDRYVVLTLPAGWEQIGENNLILRHKDTDARIMIYADLKGSLTEALEDSDTALARLSADIGISKSETTIDGYTAYRTQYDLQDVTQITYLLQTEPGSVCRINCTVPTGKLSGADLDAVLETIHFK